MLAYVFWHWPKSDIAPAQYEDDLRGFHAALARSSPSGFLESRVCRVDGEAPWLAGGPAYADWYLLETSAAIDAINTNAVSGICEQPHRTLTLQMAAGVGSLFTLRSGAADLLAAGTATLLTKPREMPYPELDGAYASAAASADSASLWRRALVLGPTPEFLALSAAPLDFPSTLQPHALRLEML